MIDFQESAARWATECFGKAVTSDVQERGDRFLEEALELLQANGYDRSRIPTLVEYVFNRPLGEPAQEVGGVMVTLAVYCHAIDVDLSAAAGDELERIWQVMPKIRAKQLAKRDIHSPLPGHTP